MKEKRLSFTIKSLVPGKSLLDKATYCQQHGCPLIPVEQDGQEKQMCLFEAVDQLVGGQRVRYVKTTSGAFRLIRFENGYQLEPLCPCCGKPSISDDGGILENKVLAGTTWEIEDYDNKEYPSLVLNFARTVDSPVTDALPVHIDSICSLQKASSQHSRSNS